MECPRCGYVMGPFDVECERCRRMSGEGRSDPPSIMEELAQREAEARQNHAGRNSLPPDPDILVIDSEDLLDVDDDAPLPPVGPDLLPALEHPPTGAAPAGTNGKAGLLAGRFVGSMLLQMAVAGGIGGLVAWMFTEPLFWPVEAGLVPAYIALYLAYGAAQGGFISMAVGGVEGVVVGAWARALGLGLLCIVVGGIGGMVVDLALLMVYGVLGVWSTHPSVVEDTIARTLAWGLFGALIGLVPGGVMKVPQKMLNGLLGGLTGGLLAGLLLSLVHLALYFAIGTETAVLPRLVGGVVLGTFIGCGVGLVEEVRKQAWVVIVSGPLTGKQFIIYKPMTSIGSASGMDIPLVKDHAIAPRHCELEETVGGHVVRNAGQAVTLVNGLPATAQRLRDGDVVHIGQTGLQYRTRPLPGSPAGQR